MTWQEYQDAVGQLYKQAAGIGTVLQNTTRPDKITGQPRQVDTWIDLETKGHKLGIEEVRSLAEAVGGQ